MAIPPRLAAVRLTTPRLAIEPLRPDDAPELYPILRDPRLYAYFSETPPASAGALRARFARYAAGPPPGRDERWLNWIVRARPDRRPIGTLQSTVEPAAGRAYVAYVFAVAAWGQGYATEATGALVTWLHAEGVPDVEALVDARNERSLRLLRRLGFAPVTAPPEPAGDLRLRHRAAPGLPAGPAPD